MISHGKITKFLIHTTAFTDVSSKINVTLITHHDDILSTFALFYWADLEHTNVILWHLVSLTNLAAVFNADLDYF